MRPKDDNGSGDSMRWSELHRRLDIAQGKIQEWMQPDQERQEQILRERTAMLARGRKETLPTVASNDMLTVLGFSLAGERYAFETAYVDQVYPFRSITPIPGVPEFIVGVIAPQGEVISVIDLRLLLNLPISRLADPVSIILLRSPAMEFGVLAEEILGIEECLASSVEVELPSLVDMPRNYLKGVSTSRTAILNAKQLLSDPRLVVESN